KEIASTSYLWLTTVTDEQDHVPSMLGVWHFNSAPVRTGYIQLGIGSHASPSVTRTATFDDDSDESMSTFMCLDISEFKPYFDAGASNIWVEMVGSGAGTLSSFRVETYGATYVGGSVSTASGQSPDVPKTMPGYASVSFVKYDPISAGQALDAGSLSFVSNGQAKWVGVNHQSYSGGNSMQSGDVSDSAYSYLLTTVSGASGISFYWKVSSESGKDLLRFYIDGSQKSSISGQVDWQKANFTLLPGTHVLIWNYTRDIGACGNKDMAWVDKVVVLPQDDAYEENDVQAQASVLTPTGIYSGLLGLDDDWYGLRVEAEDMLTARIDLNASMGDLDLYLYGTDGVTLIDSSVTTGDSEEVELIAPSNGYFYLKVQPDVGQFSFYSLTFTYVTSALDYGKNSSLAIVSGTGAFSSIAAGKNLVAIVDSTLAGTISLHTTVTWSDAETVPMIATSNWGSPLTSFFAGASDLPSGSADVGVDVTITVPGVPGTYYLIFAFRNESSAGHVASATDDLAGEAVWDDGNDIAAFSAAQILESRLVGRSLGDWLRADGMHSVQIPSDALLIEVIPPDTTPPETSYSLSGTLGSSGWYRSQVSVTMIASDSGLGVAYTHYRLNGGTWTDYSAPFPVNNQGTSIIDYYSVDNAGNAEAYKSVNVKIDLAPPITTSDLTGTAGGDGWYLSEVWLSLSGSDSTSGLQSIYYQLDGGSWLRYQSVVSVVADGQHRLYYYSIDVAGNSESARQLSISIDRTAPASSALLEGVEGNDGWYLGPVTVSLVAEDSMSGVAARYFSLDGGEWNEYLEPLEVAGQGEHQLEYRSTDLAGNSEPTRAITFGIDFDAPVSSAKVDGVMGQEGWYVSSVDVVINASDSLSGLLAIQYSLDGGSWENYTSAVTISEPGEHSLLFRAEDVAGNLQDTVELSIKLDNSLPTSELTNEGTTGEEGWFVSMVGVSPNGSDTGSGIASYYCRVDGGSWSILAGDLTLVEEGEHSIEIYAIDRAGNIGPTILRTVRIDNSAPTSSLTASGSEGDQGWFVSSLRFEIQAMDAVSGVGSIYYSISGDEWQSYLEPITIDTEGVYDVRRFAVDRAGNAEGVTSSQLKVDLSAPNSSLMLQGTEGRGGWYVSAVLGGLAATDTISGPSSTYYRLDGSNWSQFLEPVEIVQGQHELDYYSVDLAGNNEVIKSKQVWVDVLAPVTGNATQGEAGLDRWFLSQVAVTLLPEDNCSGLDLTSYRVDDGDWINYSLPFIISEEGVHQVRYRSSDLAGNEARDDVLIVMLDFTAPSTSTALKGAHGANGWFVSAVNLTMSSFDGCSGSLKTAWSLDGGDWTIYEGSLLIGMQGAHILAYRSQDRAGNWEEARLETVMVDLEPPTLKVNNTGTPFTSKDVVLIFDAHDPISNVSMILVRLDGGPAQTLSQGPWSLPENGLADGWHDLNVTIYDEAGNNVSQSLQFKVDTNPLSPEGPYGPWLLIGIVVLVASFVALMLVLRKKRK
ncbi:MAG: Ig-like domain-containing protein, partial [Methanomassiliicoccales archaeon]|nr:Ig-like domain-containing protein [Methanomassiliicoccales archaeon]